MKPTLLSLLLVAGLSSGSAYAYTYSVTSLGLYANNGARALAVNNLGQMGGFSTAGLTSTKNAFSTTAVPGITITNLHTQGGTLLGGYSGSYASGINEAGQVVGQALRTDITAYVPFVAANGGTMTELQPFGANAYGGTARDINNAGQVVGGAYTAGFAANHAYVYDTANSSGTDIGALIAGSTTSEAWSINDAGQMAGYYYTAANLQRAFVYDGSSVTTIATPGTGNAYATAINGAGQVVGSYYTGAAYPNNEQRAFSFNGGVVTDLGELLAAGNNVEARGINDAGQIVGWADTLALGGQSAFLYQNGAMVDLNTLIDPASGWTLVDAYAISNTGYIVGSALNYNGTVGAAVILTPAVLNPVPEPETYTLMLAGLGLVGFAVRRRIR